MTSPQPAGKIVVIYGGQPTSAWAVAHAIASRAGYICWLARSGITDEANPVGRNDAVMRIAKEEGYMQKGEILSIDVRNDVRPGAPRVRLLIKWDSTTDEGNYLTVDQLVYAIGADPLGPGPGDVVSKAIKDDLAPLWEKIAGSP